MSVSLAGRAWLKGLYGSYYAKTTVSLPYDPARREFGYGIASKIDSRHLAMENGGEFNAWLRNVSPLYVSASISEFMNPGAQPMAAKGWLGSDLIFEFDADDVPTACKMRHDSWTCSSCGEKGKGHVKKCTRCARGTTLDEWVCEECLDATKKLTQKLIHTAMDDFGFPENSVSINFSGSKGYHVYLRSKEFFPLPKSARVELMDYLSLHEIDVESLGFSFDGKNYRSPPYAKAKGHAKHILDELIRLIETGSETDWMILSGASPRSLQSYLSNRAAWLEELHRGILPVLPGKKTEPFWKGVLSSIVDSMRLPIDRQSSGDIYRLMRVPNTLHGSTGLNAKTIAFNDFAAFNPFQDAVVFSSSAKRKLYVSGCPKVVVGSETLDPVENAEVDVSEAMAAYLVGWGVAELR